MEPEGGNDFPDGVLGPDPLGDLPVPPPDELMPDELVHQDEICCLLDELEASIEGSVVPPPPEPVERQEPVLDGGLGYAYPTSLSMMPKAEGRFDEALTRPEESTGAPAQPGLGPPGGPPPPPPGRAGGNRAGGAAGATGGSAGLKRAGGSAGDSATHWCPVREECVTVCEEACGDCEYFEQTGGPDGEGACGYWERVEEP